jgi:hypothetical protein
MRFGRVEDVLSLMRFVFCLFVYLLTRFLFLKSLFVRLLRKRGLDRAVDAFCLFLHCAQDITPEHVVARASVDPLQFIEWIHQNFPLFMPSDDFS